MKAGKIRSVTENQVRFDESCNEERQGWFYQAQARVGLCRLCGLRIL